MPSAGSRGGPVGLIAQSGGGPWWYPKLQTWNADHFARPEFGQLNTLYIDLVGPDRMDHRVLHQGTHHAPRHRGA